MAASLSRLEADHQRKSPNSADASSTASGRSSFASDGEVNSDPAKSRSPWPDLWLPRWQCDETSDSKPGHGFSKTYGFYVLMGGLAVDVSHIHDRLKKVFLTPEGVIHLADRGYFLHVSDADIEDKSKADTLAKALVLSQIIWTVLQCLSRKIVGLPLCILEVHVLVHAGCALIMYTLWFKKPLKIEETLDVSAQIPDQVLTLMLVQNYRYGIRPYGNFDQLWEFRPARLRGSRAGSWPNRFGAEAQYLMYSPYCAGSSTPHDPHGIPVLAGIAHVQPPSIDADSLVHGGPLNNI